MLIRLSVLLLALTVCLLSMQTWAWLAWVAVFGLLLVVLATSLLRRA